MKRTVFAASVVVVTCALGAANPGAAHAATIGGDCSFGGVKLYGKVKVVQHFADFKVKVVQHFPDLKVQFVEHFPDACGKWQRVEDFPDFTIQYVDHAADLEIQKVEHFPGVP